MSDGTDTLESFATSGVSDEMRATLAAAGYVPVLRWTKQGKGHSTLCSTGEALKNIEIEAKQARCAHVRNGPTDYCARCGIVMPWTGKK